MQTFGMGQSWKVWHADLVLRDLHIWFNYQKATNDYHKSNPRLLSDIGKRFTYIDQLQEFFCRLYGATYPLRCWSSQIWHVWKEASGTGETNTRRSSWVTSRSFKFPGEGATIALCRDPSTNHLDRYIPLWTGINMGGRVKKMKEQKKFQDHRHWQLCFRSESKWCYMCVCSPFQVIRHNLKCVNWLNS